jgi:hypothetical protein
MIQQLQKAVKRAYDEMKPHLPRTVGTVNGVRTRKHPLGETPSDDYEEASVRAIKEHVKTEDCVMVLGAGWGVTTVHAARLCRDVIAYEASQRQFDIVREAVRLNGVSDTVSLHFGLVAESGRVFGDGGTAQRIDPAELPKADILEIDIEGGELAMLNGLTYNPRVLIIESHGCFGAPSSAVLDKLASRGYAISDVTVKSHEQDIQTIVAVAESITSRG